MQGFSRNTPTVQNVQAFTHDLAVMLSAGLPLDQALRTMIESSSEKRLAPIVSALLAEIKNGETLSTALASHPSLFDAFYIGIVRSGELSGRLDEAMTDLAAHLEKTGQLRSALVAALIYPLILLILGLASLGLMLGFVIPQFAPLFGDMGDALPLLTRAVMALGAFAEQYGWVVAILLTGLTAFWFHWSRTPSGVLAIHRWQLNMPMLAGVVQQREIARFARTLGTLLRHGVPILRAMGIASDTISNAVLKTRYAQLTQQIKQGSRMASAMQASIEPAPIVINMLRVGEETGQLDQMLLKLASLLETDLDVRLKRYLAFVEPILIVGLGVLIAGMIVSLLLGILSLNEWML